MATPTARPPVREVVRVLRPGGRAMVIGARRRASGLDALFAAAERSAPSTRSPRSRHGGFTLRPQPRRTRGTALRGGTKAAQADARRGRRVSRLRAQSRPSRYDALHAGRILGRNSGRAVLERLMHGKASCSGRLRQTRETLAASMAAAWSLLARSSALARLACPIAAAGTAQPSRTPYRFKSGVELVNVTATVSD